MIEAQVHDLVADVASLAGESVSAMPIAADGGASVSTATAVRPSVRHVLDVMSIYRSAAGRDAVSAFAMDALDRWDVEHSREHRSSTLGPTHLVSAGGGRPLVLFAGTNFCAATWLDLIGMLAATHRVHAIDLPGQPGLSHEERPRRTRDAYGRWLADLMPRVTDAPAVLIGHSLGTRVVRRPSPAALGVRTARLLAGSIAGQHGGWRPGRGVVRSGRKPISRGCSVHRSAADCRTAMVKRHRRVRGAWSVI